MMYFIRQFNCSVRADVYSDSMDLVKLLLSDHPKPLLRHMLIAITSMKDKLELSVV